MRFTGWHNEEILRNANIYNLFHIAHAVEQIIRCAFLSKPLIYLTTYEWYSENNYRRSKSGARVNAPVNTYLIKKAKKKEIIVKATAFFRNSLYREAVSTFAAYTPAMYISKIGVTIIWYACVQISYRLD